MTFPVIWIPFRGDDGGWRDRNFDVVLEQAESTRFKVIVHDSGHEPFSIANTWNECAAMSPSGWTHAIRWAADFLLDPVDGSLAAALSTGHHYVFCFDEVVKLDASQTAVVHSGDTFITPARSKLPFGGVNVVTRTMWDDLGGFDERFLGWGHEDRAFRHAMNLLWGKPTRVAGRMFNLWHPRSDVHYFSRRNLNLGLLAEYSSIKTAEKMRVYLDARRDA